MSLSDYTVTEAGFGSDLGAEKFINIKCRYGKLSPNAIVMVATLRAIKHHGQNEKNTDEKEIIENGFLNLKKHIENTQKFKIPMAIAINKFQDDDMKELEFIKELCEKSGVKAFICDVWWKGSEGAIELAKYVADISSHDKKCVHTYEWSTTIEEKIKNIGKNIYGAKRVNFSPTAFKKLKKIDSLGLGHLPVCIAKTPASFSEDSKLRNVPHDFILTIRDFELASGAGFIVPLAGTILRMPGLPKTPAALEMDIDNDGQISGLN